MAISLNDSAPVLVVRRIIALLRTAIKTLALFALAVALFLAACLHNMLTGTGTLALPCALPAARPALRTARIRIATRLRRIG